MFAEQRVFRGLAFRWPHLSSIGALRASLVSDHVSDGDLSFESNGLAVQHLILRSRTRFTVSPLLESARVLNSREPQYDYDLYAIYFQVTGGCHAFLAVPFRGMYSELMPVVTASVTNAGISFQTLQLSRAVATVASGENERGFVSVTGYEAVVEGDPNVRLLQLSGSDTVNSDLYGELDASRRFRLTPRRCTFSYNDHSGNSIQLSSDRYGNYSFRVAARARNLSALPLLFDYFTRAGMMRNTWSSPLDRVDPEEESNEI
jgi:hypothetical protein